MATESSPHERYIVDSSSLFLAMARITERIDREGGLLQEEYDARVLVDDLIHSPYPVLHGTR